MIFRETVQISKPVKGVYSQSNTGEMHDVRANVAQTGGLKRGGMFDALAGDASAYLDAQSDWLKSVGYNIGGHYLHVTKFGISRTYRIVNVAVGERYVTGAKPLHVEVELEEVK